MRRPLVKAAGTGCPPSTAGVIADGNGGVSVACTTGFSPGGFAIESIPGASAPSLTGVATGDVNGDGLDEIVTIGGIQFALNGSGHPQTYVPSAGVRTSSYVVPLHTWTRLSLLQSASGIKLYVNGVFDIQLTGAGQLHIDTHDQTGLGDGFTFSSNRRFAGKIDEVRIWNRALSAAEIGASDGCGLSLDPPWGQMGPLEPSRWDLTLR